MQDDQVTAPTTISEVPPFDPEPAIDGTAVALDEVEAYVNRETNPFAIPCAITRTERPLVLNGSTGYPYSRIGESSWKFKWIQRDDTYVCELPIGMRLQVDYEKDFGTVEIHSKKKFISLVHAPQVYASVSRAIKAGSIVSGISYVIIPGATNVFCTPSHEETHHGYYDQPLNEAISLDTLMRKYRYDQWHNGDKTVDSVSRWLMEDLQSRLKRGWRYTSTDDDDVRKPRPDGLLFFNRDIGQFARIMCRDFEWYYQDGKACKETHEHEVHILGQDKSAGPFIS